ncbi:MAG: ATP-binding protein [Actinobacteria bacterium]|nr:ATP-binding protein [Actinomycetota bacterium]
MTPEELRRLIAAGETLTVEFKSEERTRLNDRDLVETVICLANRPGNEAAWLLVGVEDDGGFSGARPRHGAATDVDRVAALVGGRTRPALTVHVEEITVAQARF